MKSDKPKNLAYYKQLKFSCSYCSKLYDKLDEPIYSETIKTKYNELIAAVNNKYEGETRHETALRYIKEAEQDNNRFQTFV